MKQNFVFEPLVLSLRKAADESKVFVFSDRTKCNNFILIELQGYIRYYNADGIESNLNLQGSPLATNQFLTLFEQVPLEL